MRQTASSALGHFLLAVFLIGQAWGFVSVANAQTTVASMAGTQDNASSLDKPLKVQNASVANLLNNGSVGIPAPNTGMVSLNFQDADIRNVLKVLAFKSGMNIVAAPDVTGVVNIELKNVPWQKALDVILSTYGYGYDRKDNIITVMTVENLKKFREDSTALENQEPLVSKTYVLNFAKAEDVMKVIDKLISKRGFMNFDTRTNSIIVRELQSNLELISGVIKSIDTVTPQVMIDVKVIETKLDDQEHLGIDWTLAGNITGGSRSTTFPFSSSNIATPFLPGPSSAPTSTLTYGTVNASALQAMMDILSTRDDTKTLANPRIVTLDNQKAKINISEQYPEATYSFNASTGSEQITGYNQLPIGVTFEVTPHVNNAGLVTLEMHPQISSLNTTYTVNGNQLPDTFVREVDTNVMVENGKTLVIGGLIKDSLDVKKIKIPYLGDIPFLGNLFKTTQSEKTKDEVIIFMTPHIITIGKDSAVTAAVQ